MAGFVFRFLTSFVCHLRGNFNRRLCMENEKSEVKRPFKIITVFGLENSGKTTLIWNVFNKLLEEDGELTYFQLTGNDTNDFHAIVVWKGKVIAICSIGDKSDGDDGRYIEEGIKVAIEYKAELLLNAMSDFFDETTNFLTKEIFDKMNSEYEKILDKMKVCSIYKKFKIERRDTVEKIIKQKQILCDLIIDAMQK